MSNDKLPNIKDVEIDSDGIMKYVLVKVRPEKNGFVVWKDSVKTIVRGYKWADYHGDVYDETLGQLQELGLDSECIGGGYIKHNSTLKTLYVYGYSQTFGKADHNITMNLLKKKFPDYVIFVSDVDYWVF